MDETLKDKETEEKPEDDAFEAEVIDNVTSFMDKEAHDVMTHRQRILAIDGSVSFREAVDFMLTENKSRFPVFSENIDRVIGILYFKDAMRMLLGKRMVFKRELLSVPVEKVEGLLREAVFIPETKSINDVFRLMQAQKVQMVIIADEYGQTAGLLTMEDILEEIVGNIQDEYDEDKEYIRKRKQGEYTMDGMTPLETLETELSVDFGETGFETLNGFLISRLDHIPTEEDVGAEFMKDGYRFRILKTENHVISSVQVDYVGT